MKKVLSPPLRAFYACLALLTAGPLVGIAPATAGDVSLFLGTSLDDALLTQKQTSLALSAGVDIPKTVGFFSPSELRLDLGVLFVDAQFFDNPLDANATADFDLSRTVFTAHAGPTWRVGAFNRASVFAGLQAGIAFAQNESITISDALAGGRTAIEFSSTEFSYQIPVGFEYSFTRRIGVTTRYRFLGIPGLSNDVSHIVEGGIIVKF
ncbi:MAG: hypothetical protein AAGH42_01850 [Pseudomonadota bacterium]